MGHTPAQLLCETCGYDIGGIPATVNCPECGRPIETSLPARRAGSPWQNRPSLTSWAATSALMLIRPSFIFTRLRVDSRGMRSLLLSNLFIAGALLALIGSGIIIGDPARSARTASWPVQVLAYGRSGLIGTVGITLLLFLLTVVEASGVMFFGKRKGWRITPNIAWQVCAHASIGWVLVPVFTLLSLVIWLNVSYFGFSGWFERAGRTGDYVKAAVPLAGFFAGMLIFELLVYRGVRRCRYANAP